MKKFLVNAFNPQGITMNRRTFVRAAALCALLGPLSATAQSAYPSKIITLVVPFAPGGSTDVVARAIANVAEQDLGQKIVVLNKAGAGGAIALDYVKRSEPDGYTLALFTASGATVTPHMQKVPYNALRDFSPVMNFGLYTTYLAVAADSPFKTYRDLTGYARKNPGDLAIAVTTIGAVNHLGAARLMSENKLDVEFAPFGGGAKIIAALLGGHVKAASISGEIAPMVKAGKLRALVSFTREQFPDLKDVPSIQQHGADWELDSWLGVAAPAGTPEAIRGRLEAAFIKAARNPAFLKVMDEMAMIVSVRDGAGLKQALEKSYEENGRVIRALKLEQK
jgi:tripartite-type tricarboxylate transporter receptor subunit TctC